MPGISGFSGLIYLRAQYPAIPVVIVSASDDAGTIRRSLDFGASGFIPKRFGVETLRDAIVKVMEGDVWIPPDTDLTSADDPDMTRLRDRLVTLTPQQVRVLMMLSEGLLNKQIAYELGVSEATIKAHVSAILQKLGVESRTQAVIAAAKIAGGQWRQGTPTGYRKSLAVIPGATNREPGIHQQRVQRIDPVAPRRARNVSAYSAATICCARHWPSSARSEAGFTRLVEHRDVFLARGGPHIRAAIRGDQDRRDVLAEAAADLADRGDAVAAVEMIVDQKAGDAARRRLRSPRSRHRDRPPRSPRRPTPSAASSCRPGLPDRSRCRRSGRRSSASLKAASRW